jgi:vancomycin resistance protein YoaR
MTTTTDTLPPTIDDTAAGDAAERPARRRSFKTRFFVAFVFGLLAAIAIGAGALYAYDQQHAGRILPGVRVGGVDVSGLAPDAAAAKLNESFATLGQGDIVLATPNGPQTRSFADVGRRADVDAMVADALGVGRDGNPIERVIADARTAFRGVDLPLRVTFDDRAVSAWVAGLATGLTEDAHDAWITGSGTDATVVAAATGRRADATPATAALLAALGDPQTPNRVATELPVATLDPSVTTDEATAAKAAGDRIAQAINVKIGKTDWKLSAEKIRTWITFAPTADGDYGPIIDTRALPAEVKALAKAVNTAPANARFIIKHGRISGVSAGRNGESLDTAATTAGIEALLAARAKGEVSAPFQPVVKETKPALSTEAAAAAAPKMKPLPHGTWTTYFPIFINNGFGANIWTPTLLIDGYTLAPGEKFDFWKAVGDVSYAKGYRLGGAIINGHTEPQGALAGGICSCSTTLFNAALRAGLDMGARRNHYYYITRYPLGLDATVFRSSSGSTQTMSFTNDTGSPIVIRGYKIRRGSSGYVRFTLHGVPDGRRVSFSRPIVRNIRPATTIRQFTSSLPAGSSKLVEHTADGKDVWVTRTVRDRSGKVISTDTYYSHYSRVNGIVLVGRSAAR